VTETAHDYGADIYTGEPRPARAEVGYRLWEPATSTITLTLATPRRSDGSLGIGSLRPASGA
jgi:hypothetical protein